MSRTVSCIIFGGCMGAVFMRLVMDGRYGHAFFAMAAYITFLFNL